MSKDKIPTLYNKPATAPARIDQTHPPVREQTLFGKFVSGFMARLNTQTVERNTEEVRALSAFREQQGKLADASLERDRKVEHYLKHRDDILLDDYEQHRDQMRTNRIKRAEAQEEGEHRRQLAREKRKQELAAAQFAAATAQWGRDAFSQSLPHRQERVDQMYRTGALDAQLRAVLLDKKIDDVTAKEKPTESAPKQQSNTEQMLQFIDFQIANAAANHASQEVIDNWIAIRAGLSSQLEMEKNRPE